MPAKIVDASALAALLFGEPEGEAMAAALEGAQLMAPRLLPFEIANVCLTKIRRSPRDRSRLLEAFGLYHRLEIELVDVSHQRCVLAALSSGLTAYDAAYFTLAQDTGADLVTLDAELAAALSSARRTPAGKA